MKFSTRLTIQGYFVKNYFYYYENEYNNKKISFYLFVMEFPIDSAEHFEDISQLQKNMVHS